MDLLKLDFYILTNKEVLYFCFSALTLSFISAVAFGAVLYYFLRKRQFEMCGIFFYHMSGAEAFKENRVETRLLRNEN